MGNTRGSSDAHQQPARTKEEKHQTSTSSRPAMALCPSRQNRLMRSTYQRDGGLNKIPLVTYSIFFSPGQCHGYSQRNLDFSKSRDLQRSLKPHQSLKKHTVTASQIVWYLKKSQNYVCPKQNSKNFGILENSKVPKKSVTRWVAGYESPVLDKWGGKKASPGRLAQLAGSATNRLAFSRFWVCKSAK